jgi:hypothetical protein
VALVDELVHKWRRNNYIHVVKQYTKQYKKNRTIKIESKIYKTRKQTKEYLFVSVDRHSRSMLVAEGGCMSGRSRQ